MAQFTIDKLEDILARGAFDELRGEYENQWFDAKKQPYQIEFERQKAEMARDVASLANLDGGYILIGVRTESESVPHAGDIIKEIHPFEPALVDTDQLEKILRSSIIPVPDGIEIRWNPTSDELDKGVVSIRVPPQPDTSKPFLHYYVNDKDKRDGVYVGYAMRIGSTTQSQAIQDVQRWLRAGLNYEREIVSRLEAMEARLQSMSEPRTGESFDDLEQKNDKKKVEHLVKFGLSEERLLIISAFLANPKAQISFHDRPAIVASLNQLTEGLRNGGWKALYSVEIADDSPAIVRTARKDLKAIELFPDGSAVYECNLNVLCFTSGELLGTPPRIVPVALVEVVYQYLSYYFDFLRTLEVDDQKCFVKIDLLNMHKDGVKTTLPSYTAAPMTFYDVVEAPENDFSKIIEVDTSSANRATFLLLSEIYRWFGFSDTQIPYKTEDGSAEYQTDISTFIS